MLCTEVDSDGVAQEFSHPARGEMPQVTRPDLLGMKAFNQLTKNSFDAVAHPATAGRGVRQASRVGKRFMFGAFEGRQQVQAPLPEFSLQRGLPVTPVTQRPALHVLQQIFRDGGVRKVGRRQDEIRNHSWPTQAHMRPQAIKRVLCHFVMAKGGNTCKAPTTRCSPKTTHRHRKAVHHRNQRVLWNGSLQFLPQSSLDRPQVSRLAHKRRAMDAAEPGKPAAQMCSKVPVQTTVYR